VRELAKKFQNFGGGKNIEAQDLSNVGISGPLNVYDSFAQGQSAAIASDDIIPVPAVIKTSRDLIRSRW
jgi:hypothetical protein